MTPRFSPRDDGVHELLALDLPPVRNTDPEGGKTLPETPVSGEDDVGPTEPRKETKQP